MGHNPHRREVLLLIAQFLQEEGLTDTLRACVSVASRFQQHSSMQQPTTDNICIVQV
jgi:hypothetical protein